MLHGDEKVREMSRSILPSTRRDEARQNRARVTRESRRASRTRLAALVRDPERWDDTPDLEDDTTQEMAYVVHRRRNGDKVNPFIRWARKQTQQTPRDSRLSQMRGLLPRGLIGDHAYLHLDSDDHFTHTWEKEIRAALRRNHRAAWRKLPRVDRGLAAQLLRQLLRVPDGQRAFNDFIKRTCATTWVRKTGHDGRRHVVLQGTTPPRVLHGEHDVLTFLTDIDSPRPYGTWDGVSAPTPSGKATLTFLMLFHQNHGDLAATLAALPPAKRGQLPGESPGRTRRPSRSDARSPPSGEARPVPR
ncbi:hypothetical protein LZ198_41010 [Myxococcus sp. K15C18031901]|uniref:hypothetical protein n=1 Tax=Myxococcus dinghuensis TaxID=2906761 RepID=UPI0020A6FA1F|nr:hypothetical protein [Myxococcus dinghuensis]MCP3105268.1 hypothetical protein [Myxococcus dinghuensis]